MKIPSFSIILILYSIISGQTTLRYADFETDGQYYSVAPTGYTSGGPPYTDYWIRTDGSNISPHTPFSNVQGTYFFAGEDLDNTTTCTVTLDAVSVSGYSNLQVKILVAANANTSNSKEGEEVLAIKYSFDGGGYNTIAQFIGVPDSDLYQEDSDADGTADGATLSAAFTEFTYNISGSGSSLTIQIYGLNGGAEEFAFDNIRVLGTSTPTVTFTDGSSFSPSVTSNSTNQAVGRFQLTGSTSGASLTAASIKLNGSRSGMSNIKLWSSSDNSFNSGSDTQLGSTVATDPGTGNSASYSSFSSAIATGSGTYYFVTVDVASNATGSVQGVIVENASLTISSGTLSGSISNAVLSNSDVSLPVELTDFKAQYLSQQILLNWSTASEINNLGFIVERCNVIDSDWYIIGDYRNNDELKGQGSTTQQTDYYYVDTDISPGMQYQYRLSDVDYQGRKTWLMTCDIKVPTFSSPPINKDIFLNDPWPNPFNPTTNIAYTLKNAAYVSIRIVDLKGRQVDVLVNRHQNAGNYHLQWSRSDKAGHDATSGIYFMVLRVNNTTVIKKILLIK